MGGGKKLKARVNQRFGAQEGQSARSMDALAQYEAYREAIGDKIQKDIANGLTPEEIYKKYASLAAARVVTIATSPTTDSSTALAAAKDIADRTQGKAKERSEVTHKMQNMPEDQIDALIMSKLGLTKEQEGDEDGTSDGSDNLN